jgi:hypothetical protein
MTMEEDARLIATLQWGMAENGWLGIWTVYENPADYPGACLARLHVVQDGKPRPTEHVVTGTLEHIRASLKEAGLTRMTRSPEDEPQIVESWL